jgi:hypothetical protein
MMKSAKGDTDLLPLAAAQRAGALFSAPSGIFSNESTGSIYWRYYVSDADINRITINF